MRFLSSLPTLETDYGVGGGWVGDHEASVAEDWGHLNLFLLFSFDTRGPRAPESHSFISVESGTVLSPVWGKEGVYLFTLGTFGPFPCVV